MKPDILRYRTEFTLDEVARLWAGVETETPEDRESVRSALRILLVAIAEFRLFTNVPYPIVDNVLLRTETGDCNCDSLWRSVCVTRKQLKEWFDRENWPLPPWLASEAISSAPPSNRSGHSPESWQHLIGILVILWVQKSGPGSRKGKEVNKHTLHKEISKVLEQAGVELRGLGREQFYKILKYILTEDFYAKFDKVLNSKE